MVAKLVKKPIAIRNSLVVIATLVAALALSILLPRTELIAQAVRDWPREWRWCIQPLIWFGVMLVGAWVLARLSPLALAREAGLVLPRARIARAFVFASLCSFPMLILGLFCGLKSTEPSSSLWNTALIAPISEEALLRGFAFCLLVRYGHWRVWPAGIVTGLIFGAMHLVNRDVQAMTFMGQLSWVALIAAGGIAFAWLFYRWRWNLWVAIFLHALMNTWYQLFDLAASPLGSVGVTVSRIAVITVAITATEIARARWNSGQPSIG